MVQLWARPRPCQPAMPAVKSRCSSETELAALPQSFSGRRLGSCETIAEKAAQAAETRSHLLLLGEQQCPLRTLVTPRVCHLHTQKRALLCASTSDPLFEPCVSC